MDQWIDARQLRAFLELARRGSFTEAGRALHLTQSAVSHAVKSLETELGCQLVFRLGREIQLSPHGMELARHAEAMEQSMARARQHLAELDRSPRGRIRIGCTPAAAQFFLPTVLREFKESFPLFHLQIEPGESPETVERLEKGEVDVALCLKQPDVSNLDWQPMLADSLVFVTSPGHPWTRAAPKARDLGSQTFVVASRKSATFELIADYFLKLGVRLASYIELGNSDAVKELVKLGLGVAVTAPWVVRAELEAGTLAQVPLIRGGIRRQWIVARMKARPPTLAERILMGLCQEVGANLAEGLSPSPSGRKGVLRATLAIGQARG